MTSPTESGTPSLVERQTINIPLRNDVPLSAQCSHGRLWTEQCDSCEIVSLQDGMEERERRLNRDKARLAELHNRDDKATRCAQDNVDLQVRLGEALAELAEKQAELERVQAVLLSLGVGKAFAEAGGYSAALTAERRRAEGLEKLITDHNDACQDLCGRGDQEAVRCKYRPYFVNNGRRCPECPTDYIIDFVPSDAALADTGSKI